MFGSVFFSGFLVWVWFGFFGFMLIKPKPNRTGRFFQNFNRFNQVFFTVWFFSYYFSGFLDLIGFSIFFLPIEKTIHKAFIGYSIIPRIL
jgi:hypothetical protein